MTSTTHRISTLRYHTLLAIGLLASAGGSSSAMAQEPQTPRVLEEVFVTAQKRQQNLMDVGISVAVADAQEIKDLRISVVNDIVLFSPNTAVKDFIPGLMPIITIRGVGLNDFNAANNPSTGVYIDEVSLSSLALLSSDFFDLERMEVLKGPQGTLYGRNSTAGALNVVTAKPDLEAFSASASGGYGNYEYGEVEGMLNTPLTDNLGLRLAVKGIDQGEGYWDDVRKRDDIGNRDVWMGRAQLLWTPSDRTDVLLKVEGHRARSELGSPQFFGVLPTADTSNCPGKPECSNFLGYSDTTDDPYKGAWSVDPDYTLNQFISTARIDVDFDFATLTSVTGYIDFDRKYSSDVDASPDQILDFLNKDDVDQFSQELRLAGETNAIVWQVGAFYSDDTVTTDYSGNLQALLNTTSFTTTDLKANSKAVFANVEWPIANDMTLITGLRATKEDKSNKAATTDLVSEPPASNLSGAPFGSPPVELASVDESINDTSVDWKIGLNWDLADSQMVYLSASQGTKSGGFFTGLATSDAQLEPYDPETLYAYEIGLKGRLVDYGLTYEASVFYYDYQDVQTYITDSSGAVPVNRLSNIDGATIYGLDLTASWNPSFLPDLTLRTGVGLLDTELESFESSGGVVPKGNKQPDAPDFSFSLQTRYDFDVSDNITGNFSVDGFYQTEAFHEALNNPLFESEDYWIINSRLAFQLGDDWEFAAWGKNLADEEYITQGADQIPLGNGFLVYGPPRTYGITISKQFN